MDAPIRAPQTDKPRMCCSQVPVSIRCCGGTHGSLRYAPRSPKTQRCSQSWPKPSRPARYTAWHRHRSMPPTSPSRWARAPLPLYDTVKGPSNVANVPRSFLGTRRHDGSPSLPGLCPVSTFITIRTQGPRSRAPAKGAASSYVSRVVTSWAPQARSGYDANAALGSVAPGEEPSPYAYASRMVFLLCL